MESIPNIILHPVTTTATTEPESRNEDIMDQPSEESATTSPSTVLGNISNTKSSGNTSTKELKIKDDPTNKGSGKSFMKRMLSGRNSKANAENNPSPKTKTLSRKTSQAILSNTSKASSSATLETTRNSAPRTRQQLSRTQLLPAVTMPSYVVSPGRGQPAGSGVSDKNVPRKNFVKANMLAAANAKIKSTVHLELPGAGANTSLSNTKKLGGSSRSLNSDPGSTYSSTFRRANQGDQLRKSYHASRSTNNPTAPRNSNKPRNNGQQGKPRDRKPQSGLTPNSKNANNSQRIQSRRLSPRQAFEEEESKGSSQESSRRSSWSELETEKLKSIKQKQEYFQLINDNLQSEVQALRANFEVNEERWKVKLEGLETEMKELERKSSLEKQELKEFFICQLENQRLEIRNEMRKLLTFKESSSSRSSSVSLDNETKSTSSSFKDSKEKLFNKIHRLSARMSIQDLDMKDLQEVKTWNERKLENELHRLQDSVKKPPPTDKGRTLESDQGRRQASVEKQLSMALVGNCSLSEPDLAGMFESDSNVVSMKMQKMAPSMSALESFPPPSPALHGNGRNAKRLTTDLGDGRE